MQAVQLGMPDAPLLIYDQDLPSKDPAGLRAEKAEDVTEQATEILIISVRRRLVNGSRRATAASHPKH